MNTSHKLTSSLILIVGGIFLVIGVSSLVSAFTGPTVPPPGGSGSLSAIANGNVGIGITTPTAKFHVAGSFRVNGTTTFNGVTYTWPATAGSNGQVLTTNGATPTTLSWATPSTGVGGSGTANTIPLWTGAGTTLTNSNISQVSGDVKIANSVELILSSQGSDPTGTNGAIYYNTASNKFRCYENSVWKDCIGGAVYQ